MALPEGDSIVDFVRADGRPAAAAPPPLEIAEFCTAFLAAIGRGSVEANTLSTIRIHLAHCRATLGDRFAIGRLALADLQRHVDRRRDDVAAVTIRMEIATLRTAWAWIARMGQVSGAFPNGGLVYAKEAEKLPFMTRSEIERRLASGGDPESLWECLYLTVPEVEEFLVYAWGRPGPPPGSTPCSS
jgi:site-specific recombinase XerD